MIKKLFWILIICIILVGIASEVEKQLSEHSDEISQQVSEVGEKIKEGVEDISKKVKKDETNDEIGEISVSDLPKEVQNYYERYKKDKWKTKTADLEGRTRAGDDFENNPRSEKETILPKKTKKGKKIKYKEFDAEYTPKGSKRGGKRFVHGSDGSTYYTDDHYVRYKKVIE